jgi:hypothetical protein
VLGAPEEQFGVVEQHGQLQELPVTSQPEERRQCAR